ncbi:DUF3618 domain-containing protein [Streptomyces sp.]|uniref:DUF3618 domain-containing protein n=1 Tax=Streptomyces sp. TaxID=1931 RepID=UPI002F410530
MTRGDHHKTDPALAEMEQQIARTRERLGATVEELAAKADVPGRAKAKAAEAASRVRETAHRAATSRPVSRLHVGGRAGPSTETGATAAQNVAAGTGKTVRETGAHVADTVQETDARAGAKLSRVDEDQARTLYGVAALALTAATLAALLWARNHGDFG